MLSIIGNLRKLYLNHNCAQKSCFYEQKIAKKATWGKKKQKNYGKFPFKENCQKLPFDEGGGKRGIAIDLTTSPLQMCCQLRWNSKEDD